MKKPEKKKVSQGEASLGFPTRYTRYHCGYNQAIDEYEKFLPSEEEIEQIKYRDEGCKKCGAYNNCSLNNLLCSGKVAKAITKRIGK